MNSGRAAWLRANGAYVLFAVVATLQFLNLYRFAVDVPHWDEWDFLAGISRVRSGDWTWFFERANEHLLLFSKLQVFGAYLINQWNLRTIQLVNFPLFLLLPLGLWCFARKEYPKVAPSLFGFWIVCLSPLPWENHLMGSQVCVHAVFWFLGLSAWFAFRPDPRWRDLCWSLLFSLFASLAFGNGAVGAVAITFVFLVRQIVEKRRIAPAIAYGGGQMLILALTVGLAKGAGANSLMAGVFHFSAWEYFLNLVTFGFGMDSLKGTAAYLFWLGVPLLLAIGTPFWLRRKGLKSSDYVLLAWIAAVLSGALVMALSRYQLGQEGSKSSRYFEFTVWLVPLLALVWSEGLREFPTLRKRGLLGLALLTFITFLDNWSFRPYRLTWERRQEVLQCIAAHWREPRHDLVCRWAYPLPLGPLLDEAARLKISFVEK